MWCSDFCILFPLHRKFVGLYRSLESRCGDAEQHAWLSDFFFLDIKSFKDFFVTHIGSMGLVFTYIWLNCMISLNVGKYTIHRSYWVSVWHRVSWVCVFQCPFFIAQGDPEPKRSTLHIPRIVIQFVSCKYRQASNPQTLFIRRERPCFAFENSHGGVSLWLPRVLLCCKRRFSMTSWGPNNHESGMPTKICKQQQKKV